MTGYMRRTTLANRSRHEAIACFLVGFDAQARMTTQVDLAGLDQRQFALGFGERVCSLNRLVASMHTPARLS